MLPGQEKLESLCPPQNKFLFTFEASHNYSWGQQWIEDHLSLAVQSCIIYLVMILALQRVMKNKAGLKLRPVLILWNLFLAIFSIMGMTRTMPEYLRALRKGFTYSICNYESNLCDKAFAFWSFLFVVSKVMELGDTVFLVLRKRPVIFLHWYHHTSVLIMSFYLHPSLLGTQRHFIVMNYTIHSIMYSYFTLRALRVKVPGLIAPLITCLQTLQMVLGFVTSVSVLLIGGTCHPLTRPFIGAILMYVSYLILFVHFFYKSYLCKGPSKKKIQ